MTPRYGLLLLGLPLLLAGCMRYSEVELVAVHDARMDRLDATGMSATITVEVHNPNNFRIHLIAPDVDLFLNEVSLGKATLDTLLVLERNSTRLYETPLTVTFAGNRSEVLPMLLGAALSGQALLGAKGTVTGKAKAMRRKFPFELEHRINFR